MNNVNKLVFQMGNRLGMKPWGRDLGKVESRVHHNGTATLSSFLVGGQSGTQPLREGLRTFDYYASIRLFVNVFEHVLSP